MPQATFVHEGASIDYTPGANIATGEVVVQGDLVGVAKLDILAGRLGALAVEGGFDMAKEFGVAHPVGQTVYWDNSNDMVTDTATGNKLVGKVVRAASVSDLTVRVRLSQ